MDTEVQRPRKRRRGSIDMTKLLCVACSKGDAESVADLLVRGADVRHKWQGRVSPMHAAVAAGSLPCVELLLAAASAEWGADGFFLEAQPPDPLLGHGIAGVPAPHLADQQLNIGNLLMELNPELPQAALTAFITGSCVQLAIRLRHVALAVRLLEAGASPDAPRLGGRVVGIHPLQAALESSPLNEWGRQPSAEQLALLEALLAAGVSLDVVDPAGAPLVANSRALPQAVRCVLRWVVEQLEKEGGGALAALHGGAAAGAGAAELEVPDVELEVALAGAAPPGAAEHPGHAAAAPQEQPAQGAPPHEPGAPQAEGQEEGEEPGAPLQGLALAAQRVLLYCIIGAAELMESEESSMVDHFVHGKLSAARGHGDTAAVLTALAELGATPQLADVLCCVAMHDAAALRLVLRMGPPPQVDRFARRGRLRLADGGSEMIACPILLNLQLHAKTCETMRHMARYGSPDMAVSSLARDHVTRLEIAELLAQAGYTPTKFLAWKQRRTAQAAQHAGGAQQAQGQGQPAQAAQEHAEEGQPGPQRMLSEWDPLKTHSESFGATGCCRYIMLASERPPLGPGSFARFPHAVQEAIRAFLLINGKGCTLAPDMDPGQLALLCAYKRQAVLLAEADAEREEAALLARVQRRVQERRAQARGGGDNTCIDRSRDFWAAQLDWVKDERVVAMSRMRELEHMKSARELDRSIMYGIGMHEGRASLAKRRKVRAAAEELGALERRLDDALRAGALARPQLPLAPHPARRLPRELVLRIAQVAAYPLAMWEGVGEE
eukprot:scaffold21.g2198.t1